MGDIVATIFGNYNLLCPSIRRWDGRESHGPHDVQVIVNLTFCVLEDQRHSGLFLLDLMLEGTLGCIREAHTKCGIWGLRRAEQGPLPPRDALAPMPLPASPPASGSILWDMFPPLSLVVLLVIQS